AMLRFRPPNRRVPLHGGWRLLGLGSRRARRAKGEARRTRARTLRVVAPAKEQKTLETKREFHGYPFLGLSLKPKMVVSRGNAPQSPAYQAGALLLSYGTCGWALKMAEGVGNAPTSVCADPVFETGAASLYLP